MERKPMVKHDDGSTSFDSLEGLHSYLEGRIKCEDIPHNESPIGKYVDTVFPGAREALHDTQVKSKFGKGSVGGGSLESITKKKSTQPM